MFKNYRLHLDSCSHLQNIQGNQQVNQTRTAAEAAFILPTKFYKRFAELTTLYDQTLF